jgi:hypothetical protein
MRFTYIYAEIRAGNADFQQTEIPPTEKPKTEKGKDENDH